MHSEGYSTLSVCLSVCSYSGTTDYDAAYEQYQRFQTYKTLKMNGDFLEMTAFEKKKRKVRMQATSGRPQVKVN